MAYELPEAEWQDNVNEFAPEGYVLIREIPVDYDSGHLMFPLEHAEQVIERIRAVVAQAKAALAYARD